MRGSRLLWPVVGLLLIVAMPVLAAPEFPPLTGRVVDGADMIDAGTEQKLTEMLAAHEQSSSEQIVVVTVPDLQGYSIEDFGYQLGREWGIGQKDKDNGALLLVAREERRIRIEVGYGLEGRLTDAQSAIIINQVITPAFKQGDFAGGITAGTEAMIKVLGGKPLERSRERSSRGERDRPSLPLAFLFFALIMVVSGFLRGGRRRGGGGLLGGLLLGSLLGGGMRGGGGLGGGGFGGGGGGFGGGGASGGW